MTKTVHLHVGTPKTGTSYLQHVLFHNRPDCEHSAASSYPADRFDAHFLAALDLMRMPWGGLEADAIGAWDALAAARTTLAGHARSSATRSSPPRPRAQIGHALETLGTARAPRCTWCCPCATWCDRSRPSGRRP